MRRKSAPVGVEAPGAAHADRLRRDIDAAGDDLHVLRAKSLVTVDDRLTAAGLLPLGEHPPLSLPHALVRVLRYQADETGVGSRQTMAADGDQRLEGAIPDVIDAALALVDEWGPRRRALKAAGRLGPVDVIPREAWMEAVVNAVVHRSYSMAGDHIRVSIFPHRIEVSSPGRFPGLEQNFPLRPRWGGDGNGRAAGRAGLHRDSQRRGPGAGCGGRGRSECAVPHHE